MCASPQYSATSFVITSLITGSRQPGIRQVGMLGGLDSSLATQVSERSFPVSFLCSLKEGSSFSLVFDDELELGSLSGGGMVPVVGNSLVTTVDWRELVVILRQLSESEILETISELSKDTQAC